MIATTCRKVPADTGSRPAIRLGAWIAATWLVLIAVNLVTMGLFDIAVRDLAMAVGAYTLARLAELRHEAPTAATATL